MTESRGCRLFLTCCGRTLDGTADLFSAGGSETGRYTGPAAVDESDVDFIGDLEEFTMLSDEADVLRSKVDVAVQGILEA